MTDQEIIKGLIDRDNRITEYFFYVKSRPLLTSIMRAVFSYPVEYDEMVNELYSYLMEDDAAKIRQFQYRCSIYQWLKVVAVRFYIRRRENMIDATSKESLYMLPENENAVDQASTITDNIDIEQLLEMMPNQRYPDVIRSLLLNDMPPEKYAAQIGVTVDNLYNIKKRAMTAITRIAIKYYSYGK